jgi:hypothetical protein
VVNLKVVPHNDDDLWLFVMLPDAGPVNTTFPSLFGSCFTFFVHPNNICPHVVTVHATRSDPPTPRLKASRPLIHVLVINDNHCGLKFYLSYKNRLVW